MKKIYFKLLLLNFLFLIQANGIAQNMQINTRLEKIQIENDTSFTTHISVLFKKSDELMVYPVFYDTELEEVSELKLFIKKGKRFKPEKNPYIREEDVEIDYITSKKVKSIVIPPEVEARIDYTVKCKELMYFTDLPLFTYDDADTLKYQVIVPDNFRFSHNIIYKDSLEYLSIDSRKLVGSTKWMVEVIPEKIESNPLMYFGIYRNLKVPLMRTIVVPAAYENKEKEYMNDWYLRNVETRRGLDAATISKIDELTKDISDPEEVMRVLYNYVRTNFKYVAIEIGMGAFIPTNVNEVFTSKQGDCKDLSNFLSEALNYKGIKSDVALAATYHHISDCDFPSLGSANHVICVAYINDKTIFLDPTDPIHLPETPVQSLQERTVLIINPDGGEFYKMNCFTPLENVIEYDVALNADSKKMLMAGGFRAKYNGISGNFLRHEFTDISEEEIIGIGEKYYESVFKNHSISEFQINNYEYVVDVEGKLSVNGKIFNDGNSRFLFIDFLPDILENEERETLLEGTYLGHTVGKKVKLRIKMDEPFEAFTPIKHTFSEKGVSLNIIISNPSESNVECNYDFTFDHIFIEKENMETTNEILKSFKKIINEPIILKNKK